jgi:hypothetical protein
MKRELTTSKLTPSALRLLRMIAGFTGETQYEVAERLLRAEAKRLSIPLPKE